MFNIIILSFINERAMFAIVLTFEIIQISGQTFFSSLKSFQSTNIYEICCTERLQT